jgi:argininosuccinate lyase
MGAFTTAVMTMHASPFSNSVAVGTEGIRPFWNALQDITIASALLRLIVIGAVPDKDAMLRRAEEGFVTATELANRVAAENGLDYRSAHRSVGEAISATLEHNGSLEDIVRALDAHGLAVTDPVLNPASVAMQTVYGGGPGLASFERCFEQLKQDWSERRERLRSLKARWRATEDLLILRVRELCSN